MSITGRLPETSLPRMRRSAFTLIELLVVITVISVLAALLLPTLGAAMKTARRIDCANRLKQVMLGEYMYAGDNGDIIVLSCGNASFWWPWRMFVFGRLASSDSRFDYEPYLPDMSIISCPQVRKRYGQTNQWDCYGGNITSGDFDTVGPKAYYRILVRLQNLNSRQILVADTARKNNTDWAQPHQWYYFLSKNSFNWEGALHARHGEAVNAVFGDGHVEGCRDPRLRECNVNQYFSESGQKVY